MSIGQHSSKGNYKKKTTITEEGRYSHKRKGWIVTGVAAVIIIALMAANWGKLAKGVGYLVAAQRGPTAETPAAVTAPSRSSDSRDSGSPGPSEPSVGDTESAGYPSASPTLSAQAAFAMKFLHDYLSAAGDDDFTLEEMSSWFADPPIRWYGEENADWAFIFGDMHPGAAASGIFPTPTAAQVPESMTSLPPSLGSPPAVTTPSDAPGETSSLDEATEFPVQRKEFEDPTFVSFEQTAVADVLIVDVHFNEGDSVGSTTVKYSLLPSISGADYRIKAVTEIVKHDTPIDSSTASPAP